MATRNQLAARKTLWAGLDLVVVDTEATGLAG